MNYRGSYRHLLRNGKAALLAAVEIYNKPRFAYRDECFIILLLNAWELSLKALLSKSGKSIFHPKKRKEAYRTLSLRDALGRAEALLPKDLPPLPVRRNLELLATYRDNAVHFYNKPGFGSVIYALAQTSIVNLKDLLSLAFGVELSDEITWQLLPIGLKPPIDPIEYITKQTENAREGERASPAVRQFLMEITAAATEVHDAGADTGRLLTAFAVKLESTKKIAKADVVVGVQGEVPAGGPLMVEKLMDPNVTHPLRQKEAIEKIGALHGRQITPYVFQAIVWKHKLKENPQVCWKASEGVLTRYSNDAVAWIRRLSQADIEAALTDYRTHLKTRSQAGRRRQ